MAFKMGNLADADDGHSISPSDSHSSVWKSIAAEAYQLNPMQVDQKNSVAELYGENYLSGAPLDVYSQSASRDTRWMFNKPITDGGRWILPKYIDGDPNDN